MRNNIKILGIILICFCSCKNPNNNGVENVVNNQKQIKTDERISILINSEHNKWLEKNYGYKQWNPATNDIKIVQEVLDNAIKNNEFDFLKKPIKQSIKKYYRQYIPYINEDGDRIIEIKAFCKILESLSRSESKSNELTKTDLTKEYFIVSDGGICYWRIKINIDKKEYKNLMVNGVA